jgi:mannosyltransferase
MKRVGAHSKLLEIGWVASCLALSAVVQLSFITRSSIWHDEGYSLALARMPLGEILTRTARDVHPPLYYLVLNLWMKLFGTSELAARSLSVLAVLVAALIMYFLVKRLFGVGAARVAVLFTAVGPFLIRYGQEARMYALVACLIALATYLLVSALDERNKKRLYLYGVVMGLAFLTHYYSVFMVPVHWLYVLSRTPLRRRIKRAKDTLDLKSWHWWGSNLLAAGLFLPWLPVVLQQFGRVQSGFWISPVNQYTLPNTVWHWLLYTSTNFYDWWWQLGLLMVLTALVVTAIMVDKTHRKSLILLALATAFTPLMIFVISKLAQPVYIDRYFVYAAMAFYPVLAVLLYTKPLHYLHRLRIPIIILALLIFGRGIRNVYRQSDHQMRSIGHHVSQQIAPGDELVAGELYVYLDFTYYNHSNHQLKLYAPSGISGYGETSLIYDRPELVVRSWSDMKPASRTVWVIGKVGDKDYFRATPANWRLETSHQAKDVVARKYTITP